MQGKMCMRLIIPSMQELFLHALSRHDLINNVLPCFILFAWRIFLNFRTLTFRIFTPTGDQLSAVFFLYSYFKYDELINTN